MPTKKTLWQRVEKTDPKFTKWSTLRGGFTSICGEYMIQRATEEFGPIGKGWGYDCVHTIYESAHGELALCDLTLWWTEDDKRYTVGPIRGCNPLWTTDKEGKKHLDDDAPKKAMTDVLKKALSQLGFCADVYLNTFEDDKYSKGTGAAPGAPRQGAPPTQDRPCQGAPQGKQFTVLDEPIPQDYNEHKAEYNKDGFFLKKIGGTWNKKTRKTEGGEWKWVTYNEVLPDKRLEAESAPTTQEDEGMSAGRLEDYRVALSERMWNAGYKGPEGWDVLCKALLIGKFWKELPLAELDIISKFLDTKMANKPPRDMLLDELNEAAGAKGIEWKNIDSKAELLTYPRIKDCTDKQLISLTKAIRASPAKEER